jgi:hypothetical protein
MALENNVGKVHWKIESEKGIPKWHPKMTSKEGILKIGSLQEIGIGK